MSDPEPSDALEVLEFTQDGLRLRAADPSSGSIGPLYLVGVTVVGGLAIFELEASSSARLGLLIGLAGVVVGLHLLLRDHTPMSEWWERIRFALGALGLPACTGLVGVTGWGWGSAFLLALAWGAGAVAMLAARQLKSGHRWRTIELSSTALSLTSAVRTVTVPLREVAAVRRRGRFVVVETGSGASYAFGEALEPRWRDTLGEQLLDASNRAREQTPQPPPPEGLRQLRSEAPARARVAPGPETPG